MWSTRSLATLILLNLPQQLPQATTMPNLFLLKSVNHRIKQAIVTAAVALRMLRAGISVKISEDRPIFNPAVGVVVAALPLRLFFPNQWSQVESLWVLAV